MVEETSTLDTRKSAVRGRDLWASPEWIEPDLTGPCEEIGRGEGRGVSQTKRPGGKRVNYRGQKMTNIAKLLDYIGKGSPVPGWRYLGQGMYQPGGLAL